MCGFIAAVGDAASGDVGRALQTMQHRGPDGDGVWEAIVKGRRVALGHRRLAILDRSPRGAQPMTSNDGRWIVSFNGEIYNHLELRRRLPRPFRGHSDTETLAEALAEWGIEETLVHLNGMYAFAAVDLQDAKLHVARDPFGVKPAYFASDGSSFACASEIRALRSLGASRAAKVDHEALKAFLTLRFVPSTKTLLAGVQRLLPGHLLSLDVASLACETRYISPSAFDGVAEATRSSDEELLDEYDALFRKVVRRQLLSDVPVGVLLSGGVDSALLAVIARQEGTAPPTYTVGFGEHFHACEIAEAAATAAELKLPNYSVRVDEQLLWTALPKAIASTEEPLGTTSILPMWYLTRRAREDVTVALTGQGADEPWGGYGRYRLEMLRERIPFVDHAPRPLVAALSRVPLLSDTAARGFNSIAVSDEVERFCTVYELFTPKQRLALIGSSESGYAAATVRYWQRIVAEWAASPAERMMSIDARMNLADDLLLYGDKVSMATSLEARVPMLDVELIRFVERLPLRLRATFSSAKILHRRLAERYLSPEIVRRKKKGFQVPFREWSRGVWRDRLEDHLLGADASYLQCVDRSAVAECWSQHLRGSRDLTRQIFALLTLSIWWNQCEVA